MQVRAINEHYLDTSIFVLIVGISTAAAYSFIQLPSGNVHEGHGGGVIGRNGL